jgi:hypothetical protein
MIAQVNLEVSGGEHRPSWDSGRSPFQRAAEHFKVGKHILLARWRERVRADSNLPEQRVKFSDRELVDHLPALLDSIIDALEGKNISEKTLRQEGAQHGHTRRASGYAIAQVIWEFAIFRTLLRETLKSLHPLRPLTACLRLAS